MLKYLFIVFMFTPLAHSQILSEILGRSKNSDIQVKWDCPQHKYPKLRQLATSSTTKVYIELKDGHLKTSIKPNIFKSSPFNISNLMNQISGETSVAVDYADCIKRFKESIHIAVKNFQNSSPCQNQSKKIACSSTTEELDQSLSAMIDQSDYFKRNNNKVQLPRLLPLSEKNLDVERVNSIIQSLRKGIFVPSEDLYSREVFNHISNRLGSVNAQVLEMYQKGFDEYRSKFQKDHCHIDMEICKHLEEKMDEVNFEVVTKINGQLNALKSYTDPSISNLNAPIDEAEATEQLKKLLETEPFSCDFMNQSFKSGNRFFQAAQFPEAFSKNLGLLESKADSECMRNVLQNVSVSMSYRQEMTDEFWNKCEKDWTAGCDLARIKKELILENFRKLWAINFGDLGKDYLAEFGSLLCHPDNANPSKNIAEIIADHKKALACMDLKPGQAKPVTFGDGTPSGLWGRYVIKKKENGDHEIIVGIDVKADSFGVKKEEMHGRIKTCMEKVSPYMKGPSGNKLDFKIVTPEENRELPSHERPGINPISIQQPNSRSNSASYEADIDCPTIAHEVLHLLGLCDEYNGNGDGYTCRTAADVPSIMSNHHYAFALAVPRTITCECIPGTICESLKQNNDDELKIFYTQPSIYSIIDYESRNKYCEYKYMADTNWQNLPEKSSVHIKERTPTSITLHSYSLTELELRRVGVSRFRCRCENSNDQDCLSFLSKVEKSAKNISNESLGYCPPGSIQRGEEYGAPIGPQSVWTDTGIKITKAAKEKSLLHPNHYERIIGGSCATRAVKYNQCAVWAYRKKEDTNNCADRPEHCANGREFLGIGAQ